MLSWLSGRAAAAWEWLRKEKDPLTALIAIVGVPVAIYGIYWTATNVLGARKQLEATVIFNIQSDGRALLKELSDSDTLRQYVMRNDDQGMSPSDLAKADLYLRRVMQYYSSIAFQRRAGVIGDGSWVLFQEDLCGALRLPIFKKKLDETRSMSPRTAALFNVVGDCK